MNQSKVAPENKQMGEALVVVKVKMMMRTWDDDFGNVEM